jgi:putative ABC transport system permease protein
MHTTEAMKIAFLSLWANKLRSALTLLGVVIGVAAVIAVVTFVNGINGYVAEKIFNLGADVFIIFKVSPAVTNVDHFIEGQKRKDLTMDDYRAVREGCKLCAYVGAYARNNSGHVKYGAISQRHHRPGDDARGCNHSGRRCRFWPHARTNPTWRTTRP